jgi:RHS repeat-associated protein
MKVCSTINGQTETLVEKFYDEATTPSAADPNGKGNTIRTKDAWNRERWARFDWAERLCEVVEPDAAGTGSVATGGTLTKYSYDILNNLTQVDQNVVSGVAEQTRKFKYDALSRLTHQKLAERDCTLNDAGTHVGTATGLWSDVFTYDTCSNLVCHTDARAVKTNFVYSNDPLNRLQSVSYDKTLAPTAANIVAAATVTYEYMTASDRTRLKKITDGVGTDEFAYDVEGRLCETKRIFTNRGAYPVQVNYLFDTLDRLSQLTYPAQYGQAGAPRKVETMTFDEASRVNGLTYDSISRASAITYNAASQTTALNIGNNSGSQLSESYTYEPATGLLSNQKVQRQGTGTPLMDLSYEYTKYGTTVGRTGQLTKIVNNKDTTKNKYYDYDALGRLKTLYSFTNGNNPMTTNQWTQAYTYDRFGNRTGVTKTGTIGYADGITALGFTDGAGKVKTNRITTAGYEYDEAGNQTRGQVEGATQGTFVWQRYQYDAAGRLACTKADNGTVIADYGYGASNHRLKQTEAGTTCYYAWDGNSILAEYSEPVGQTQLSWAKSYVYLGGRLLATQTPSATNYHHPDRLGTRLVTSAATAIEQTEQTTLPYGMALDVESWGTATNRRFTSYDRSQTTKLDYAVNRFYSAAQGRFTQVDPIGMRAASLEDPQSFNLYAYVGGDPINRADPNGLFWKFIGKIFRFIAKVATAALVAIVLLVQPGLGAALILLGLAGLTGLAGWHNGKVGNFARTILSVGVNNFGKPSFKTPPIFGSLTGGVGRFLATETGVQQQSKPPTDSISILGKLYTIYGSVHDAAIAALNKYNPISRSRAVNKEHGGNICVVTSPLYKGQVGGFIFTDTVGAIDTVDPDNAPCPAGTNRVGAWHTHGAYDRRYLSEVFSPDDKIWSNDNFALGVSAFYVATPGRQIKLFIPAGVPGTTRGRVYPLGERTR